MAAAGTVYALTRRWLTASSSLASSMPDWLGIRAIFLQTNNNYRRKPMNDRVIVLPRSRLPAIGFFVGVGLLVGLGALGYAAYQAIMEENIRLRGEITEFKQLTDTLVRSSTEWVTRDDLEATLASSLTARDLEALYKDIRRLEARLVGVGTTVGVLAGTIMAPHPSPEQGEVNPHVEEAGDGRLIDVHRYTERPQIDLLRDANQASLARVTFDASRAQPWSAEVFERNYLLTTVVSEKESGQLILHHNLRYTTSADGDKEFPVALSSSEFKQTPLASKFHWLNPRLDMGVFAGLTAQEVPIFGDNDTLASVGLDLGVSLSSYGETRLDSWWRFFRLGAGYNANRRAFQMSFSPALFNLGKVAPLITDLGVGPNVGVDTGGGLTVNLGLGGQL
jgi:hypothetical protein